MMEVAILGTDCSRRGVQAAGRIAKLMKELNFFYASTENWINRESCSGWKTDVEKTGNSGRKDDSSGWKMLIYRIIVWM